MPQTQGPIIILGAGVIGLTTAVRILESPSLTAGREVHVVAAHMPSDPLDAHYASSIAGAHLLSFADDADWRQRGWDLETFKIMYAEWKQHGEATGLMAVRQTETWAGGGTHLKIYEEHPDFEILDPSTSPWSATHMVRFTSLTITPALYLSHLERRIVSLGGRIHRAHVPSLGDLCTSPSLLALYATPPSSIVVCTGLGSRTLGGVADDQVFPTRGQVVRVRAPWVRSGWTRQEGSLDGGEGGKRTYVIPRCTGDVILGGTREEGDWWPYPRNGTTEDILLRAGRLCLDVVPAYARNGERGGGASGSVSVSGSVDPYDASSPEHVAATGKYDTSVDPYDGTSTTHRDARKRSSVDPYDTNSTYRVPASTTRSNPTDPYDGTSPTHRDKNNKSVEAYQYEAAAPAKQTRVIGFDKAASKLASLDDKFGWDTDPYSTNEGIRSAREHKMDKERNRPSDPYDGESSTHVDRHNDAVDRHEYHSGAKASGKAKSVGFDQAASKLASLDDKFGWNTDPYSTPAGILSARERNVGTNGINTAHPASHHDHPESTSRQAQALRSIVVDSIVGFRPSRVGGTRLEASTLSCPSAPSGGVRVVFNYGHGGAGWQSSWGCAADVVRLLGAGSDGGEARAEVRARL